VCHGIYAPLTPHEKAYLKYRYIQNAEKYVRYEYSDVSQQKQKVSEKFLYSYLPELKKFDIDIPQRTVRQCFYL